MVSSFKSEFSNPKFENMFEFMNDFYEILEDDSKFDKRIVSQAVQNKFSVKTLTNFQFNHYCKILKIFNQLNFVNQKFVQVTFNTGLISIYICYYFEKKFTQYYLFVISL